MRGLVSITRTVPSLGSRTSAGLAAVLATAAIGCGGVGVDEGTSRIPGAAVQRAAARATPADLNVVRKAVRATLAFPAGAEFRLDGSRAFGSSPAPVLGSGEFDFPSGTGSETIDLGEVGHQEPGTEHVVFLPSQVYLQPKSSTAAVLPKGKAWMSARLTGSESVNTNFPLFALQAEGVNPQLLLAELAWGAVSAAPAGRALINQEPARAYDVAIDLTRALSASTGPAGPVFGQAIQSELAALGSGHGKQGTSIRTWVGVGGRVVQLQAAPPGAGVGTATITMCCFGSPVEVAPPPPSQVVDITALTPSGERENNGGGDSDGG
jgi:hypothetical protein